MRFQIGDKTDKALTTTIAHEFTLCAEAFERFAHFAKLNIAGQRDKRTKINSHNAYPSFLHHLFEFYIACWSRDFRSTAQIEATLLDAMFNNEVTKILKNRVEAIEQGQAPAWENHKSVYQVSVPAQFGIQFRRIRNRTAHASTKRSAPGTDLSLAEFYEVYHPFAYLLYYAGKSFWDVKDIEGYDWKSIEEFDLAVQASPLISNVERPLRGYLAGQGECQYRLDCRLAPSDRTAPKQP